MGTRADFYIGRGENAEWIGSIAYDGYPEGGSIQADLKEAKTVEAFRAAVGKLMGQDDWTSPEMGWPWPWETSATTDYAYAFDEGAVWASGFGGQWFDPNTPDSDDEENHAAKEAVFPNMKDRQNVTFGKRSGVLILGMK